MPELRIQHAVSEGMAGIDPDPGRAESGDKLSSQGTGRQAHTPHEFKGDEYPGRTRANLSSVSKNTKPPIPEPEYLLTTTHRIA